MRTSALIIFLFCANCFGQLPPEFYFMSRPSSVAQADTNGLFAWWQFEEGSGASSLDSVGSKIGTNVNTAYVAGKVGSYAQDFNGSTAYIRIPSITNSTFAVEFWYYQRASANSFSALFSKYNSTAAGDRSFHIANSGTLGSLLIGVNVDGTYGDSGGVSALPMNQWHHIGVYYDGEAAALFTNGNFHAVYGARGSIVSSPGDIYVGCRIPASSASFLNGSIDNIKYYSNAVASSVFYASSGQTNKTPTNATTLLNLTAEGDSMTAGGAGFPDPLTIAWPLLLKTNVGTANVFVSNYAVSGDNWLGVSSRQLSMAKAFAPNALTNAYVVMTGNDLSLGASAITVYGRMTVAAKMAMDTGYKVYVGTIMKRGTYTTAQEIQRTNFNFYLMGHTNWLNGGVIDYAGNTNLDYSLHPENYHIDTIHQNTAGSQIMADMVRAALGW